APRASVPDFDQAAAATGGEVIPDRSAEGGRYARDPGQVAAVVFGAARRNDGPRLAVPVLDEGVADQPPEPGADRDAARAGDARDAGEERRPLDGGRGGALPACGRPVVVRAAAAGRDD